jgi:hypothetical protein
LLSYWSSLWVFLFGVFLFLFLFLLLEFWKLLPMSVRSSILLALSCSNFTV